MTSNYGDASTVVGDAPYKRPESLGKDSDYPIKPQASRGQAKAAPRLEFTTTDYTLEERPFFVPIGKDGVIAALEKLDGQLRAVCC